MSWEDAKELKVFAGRRSREMAQNVCDHLDIPLGVARTDAFPDGELIVSIEEDVRGRDCFVILSTCMPVNDNLMELLIFADALRRASARRITAVVPYFGYARQDRKDRGRTPITAKLVANLITEAGFDRVVAMDLHAAQLQGFFDIMLDHLAAQPVIMGYLEELKATLDKQGKELVVLSPDAGNTKVAQGYAEALDASLAYIDKRRISGSEVKTANIIGPNLEGKAVLMVDDMVSTAGTICGAANIVAEHGVTDITVAATHALMVGPALERLQGAPIKRIIVTNTIPLKDRLLPIGDRIVELDVAPVFAEAIDHIHHNKSVSSLFNKTWQTKR